MVRTWLYLRYNQKYKTKTKTQFYVWFIICNDIVFCFVLCFCLFVLLCLDFFRFLFVCLFLFAFVFCHYNTYWTHRKNHLWQVTWHQNTWHQDPFNWIAWLNPSWKYAASIYSNDVQKHTYNYKTQTFADTRSVKSCKGLQLKYVTEHYQTQQINHALNIPKLIDVERNTAGKTKLHNPCNISA